MATRRILPRLPCPSSRYSRHWARLSGARYVLFNDALSRKEVGVLIPGKCTCTWLMNYAVYRRLHNPIRFLKERPRHPDSQAHVKRNIIRVVEIELIFDLKNQDGARSSRRLFKLIPRLFLANTNPNPGRHPYPLPSAC